MTLLSVLLLLTLTTCGCLWSTPRVVDAVTVGRTPHRFYTVEEFASAFGRDQPSAVERVLRDHATFERSGALVTSTMSSTVTTRFRAGEVHHVRGGLLTLGFYFVEVRVGSPSVPFTLLLDTGSSNIGIAGARGCDDQPPKSCTGASHVYDARASSTARVVKYGSPQCNVCNPNPARATECVFGEPMPAVGRPSMCGTGISYGGGSSYIQGHLVEDRVELDGLVVDRQLLTSIDRMIPDNAFTQGGVQGIIGFAHELNACVPTYSPTLYHNLRTSQPRNATGVIGLCLDPSHGGSIDFAGADARKYSGELQWVPITQERWYNMAVLDVRVGTASLELPPFVYGYANDAIGAFVDSGTSALLFGPTPFAHLAAIFQQPQYASLPGIGGLFTGATCVSTATMGTRLHEYPTVHIVLRGVGGAPVTLSVPSSSYFLKSGTQYCFAVSGVPSLGIVMGDVLMQNYYIAHDQVRNRVGFAPVTRCV